jgi:hypothetical protein
MIEKNCEITLYCNDCGAEKVVRFDCHVLANLTKALVVACRKQGIEVEDGRVYCPDCARKPQGAEG